MISTRSGLFQAPSSIRPEMQLRSRKGKYEVDGEVLFVYTDRNGDRMPDYHR